MGLFHITTRSAWQLALDDGAYWAPSLDSEGFIHLSGDRQWLRVANARFRGQRDLVLLSLRRDRLGAELRFEEADGDTFPHLYGLLALEAVVEVFDLIPNADGTFAVPAGLAPWSHYFEDRPKQ